MRLFISYSRVDTQFIHSYVTRLRRMFPGSFFWFDEELHGGDNWWNAILDQVESCDIFIYLLSNESLMSPYCRAELAEAQRLQKRIITVMVRPRTNIPPELSDIQYVDMKNGVNDPDALTNMSRAINYQRDNLPIQPLVPLWEPRTERPSANDLEPLSIDGSIQLPHAPSLPIDINPVPEERKGYGKGIVVSMIALIVVVLIIVVIALPKEEDSSVIQTAAALAMTNTQNAIASFTKTPTPTVTNTPTSTLTPTITPSHTPTLTPTPTATFIPLNSLANLAVPVINPHNAAKLQPIGQLQIGKIELYGKVGIDWSPDGKLVAISGTRQGIKIFSISDLSKPLYELQKFTSVTSIDFSPDQKFLVSSGWDQTIRIWNVQTGEFVRDIYDRDASVVYSPAGRYLLGSAPNFGLSIWQASTGQLLRTISAHKDGISSVAYSPDGRYFVSSSMDTSVKVWDALTGETIFTLNGDPYCATSVTYSPDKGTILSGGCDNYIKLWNAASGKLIYSKRTTNTVNTVAYNPASNLIIAGDNDQKITIWNAANGEEIIKLNGHLDELSVVSFSPDGRFLASGSIDGAIIIWGVPSN